MDFWVDFNYVGLKYLEASELLEDFEYYNGFRILKSENEVTLLFLKKLLHMKE